MLDMPLAQTGAIISMATANDEDHPASNVIDGQDGTFWMTTGLFPQSLIVSFPQTVDIKSMKITGCGIKHLIVEKCSKSNPTDFEMFSEKNLKNEGDRLQSVDIKMSHDIDARHLKFIVNEGYRSFIAVQHIHVDVNQRRH